MIRIPKFVVPGAIVDSTGADIEDVEGLVKVVLEATAKPTLIATGERIVAKGS